MSASGKSTGREVGGLSYKSTEQGEDRMTGSKHGLVAVWKTSATYNLEEEEEGEEEEGEEEGKKKEKEEEKKKKKKKRRSDEWPSELICGITRHENGCIYIIFSPHKRPISPN